MIKSNLAKKQPPTPTCVLKCMDSTDPKMSLKIYEHQSISYKSILIKHESCVSVTQFTFSEATKSPSFMKCSLKASLGPTWNMTKPDFYFIFTDTNGVFIMYTNLYHYQSISSVTKLYTFHVIFQKQIPKLCLFTIFSAIIHHSYLKFWIQVHV